MRYRRGVGCDGPRERCREGSNEFRLHGRRIGEVVVSGLFGERRSNGRCADGRRWLCVVERIIGEAMKTVGRMVVGVLLLALVAGAGVFAFKRQIGEAMFRRVVERNLGRDRAAELPDGLQVYLCGTGSPMPDPSRAGPCLGVVAGDRAFVFDAGSGSARVLGRMGFPMARLERVYLTHLHSDHFDGLGELLLQAWIGGARTTPLAVAGPEGVAEVVDGFNTAYRIDSGYRTAHHGPEIANPASYGGVAERIDTPGDDGRVVLQDGDLTIRAITVSHAPVAPAFGYRIDYRGRSIALSGDTTYNENFVAAASGVDVMFHESLSREFVSVMEQAARARGQAPIAKILSDIQGYHATPEDAARAAREARARLLVLYHIVPPLPSPLLYDAYLGDSRATFSAIQVGEDGLLVSMPANTDEIHISRVVR